MDQQDQTSSSEQSVTPHKDNLSRRRLLQGAAVTAAAAAAGSAVVVANGSTRAGARQLIQSFTGNQSSVSGSLTTSMCFTGSNYTQYSSFTVDKHGNTNPGTFFVWFTAHNVPAGKYTITILPDPGAATTPFALQSNGNNAYLFKLAANGANDCPSADPATQVGAASNFDGLFSYTFTGSNSDIQARVHISWTGGGPIASSTVYTFTGKIINDNTSATVGTNTVSVTATPA